MRITYHSLSKVLVLIFSTFFVGRTALKLWHVFDTPQKRYIMLENYFLARSDVLSDSGSHRFGVSVFIAKPRG